MLRVAAASLMLLPWPCLVRGTGKRLAAAHQELCKSLRKLEHATMDLQTVSRILPSGIRDCATVSGTHAARAVILRQSQELAAPPAGISQKSQELATSHQ